jgi:hypothetical protein
MLLFQAVAREKNDAIMIGQNMGSIVVLKVDKPVVLKILKYLHF